MNQTIKAAVADQGLSLPAIPHSRSAFRDSWLTAGDTP
jgi:hypothetical protein